MNLYKLLKNTKKKLNLPEESLLEHFGILSYEVGDLGKCLVREYWGNPLNVGEVKLSIADAFAQLRVIAEMANLDPGELWSLGEDHLVERLEQAVEDYGEEKGWY